MLSATNRMRYGDEFESLDTFATPLGEVKVLKSKISKNNKQALVTKAKNRVYAMVDKRTGRLRELYFFNSMGAVSEVWNIGWDQSSHRHKKGGTNSSLHKHFGPNHTGEKRLTRAERRLARRIDRQWRNRKAFREGLWKT